MTLTADTPRTLAEFTKLIDTEDYLNFFGISYDPTFVNVNRLHILKQFSLLVAQVDKAFPDLSESEKLEKYKLAFSEAYELFKTSSPLETKLFKVFKDVPSNVVLLDDLTKEAGIIH
ncbi:nitrogenase-stabilizing/protective protein NifW [Cyanothece sp. BG0011]|uniref:nitrogenase-stabilizing/protective protein NifW n=1 Tax=Cyanothece sp. BG0011 TaxID=2082950 RepID=UPI000D1EEC58|nr:nitrogenase-stabilizing/protective protein NifW [Cyanothece sp. BG0011]